MGAGGQSIGPAMATAFIPILPISPGSPSVIELHGKPEETPQKEYP